jgi:hypothetical protein
MGLEANCDLNFKGKRYAGLALLEEKEIHFRADPPAALRLKIPFATMKAAEARRGALHVKFSGGVASFALGAQAEKWALKIRYPRSRMDKLGVKPESRVAVLGVAEEAFHAELRARLGPKTKTDLKFQISNLNFKKVQRSKKLDPQETCGFDLIFLDAETQEPLKKLAALKKAIQPGGAIWVVWPKGQKHIREGDVRAAALQAGLVDVKVCAFSETHSALKLMIPRINR